MQKLLTAAGLSTLIAVVACGAIAPGNEAPGDNGTAIQCDPGHQLWNGACHTTCETQSQCDPSEDCASVGSGVSLCMANNTACTYRASDTGCYIAPGNYASPYDVDIPASYFTPYSYAPMNGSFSWHCVGNGQWTSTPMTTDPGCGQSHAVVRCALVGLRECALLPATTVDIAEP